MAERAMRPFWIHQLAEYLIGVSLVAQGMQGPEPVVPCVAGALVVMNAAIVRGPLGAFRWVGRSAHRWFDLAVMVAIAVGIAQPWFPLDAAGRLIMAMMLVPLGFLWFYTDWAERPDRAARRAAAAGPTGEQVGRGAGRLAGTAYSAARREIRKRSR